MKSVITGFLVFWLSVFSFAQAVNISPPSVISFALLAKSGVASAHTGDTNESILATIAVPANSVGVNGQIKINSYWTVTNSTNSKTPRIRLGTTGITSTQISTLNASWTTLATGWISMLVQNLNATNSQNTFTEAARGTDGIVFTLSATSAIDMTTLQNIYITGQLGVGTETITLVGYTVEYAN